MAELEIIGVPFSNYVRSVRMLCEEKGVGYSLTPARPHAPEVTAISPTGQIPVMRHGDVALFESNAIATYIDMAFPGPRFIPDDPAGAARVQAWVSVGNLRFDRWMMREFVVPTVFADKEKGPDLARTNAALPEIAKVLDLFEGQLAKSSHLAGEALTWADMNVLPMLDLMRNFPATQAILAAHPKVAAHVERLTQRPSFTSTAPPPRR
jgi:glutathione S-transferase